MPAPTLDEPGSPPVDVMPAEVVAAVVVEGPKRAVPPHEVQMSPREVLVAGPKRAVPPHAVQVSPREVLVFLREVQAAVLLYGSASVRRESPARQVFAPLLNSPPHAVWSCCHQICPSRLLGCPDAKAA